MEWVKVTNFKPKNGVNVYVLTKNEKQGVANYCRIKKVWTVVKGDFSKADKITRWKYAEPIVTSR